MTARGRQAVQSAERLRQVLERTAGALATADLDALLRSDHVGYASVNVAGVRRRGA